MVDTGLMFPTAEMLGIDLVLPDFSYLRDRADDIEAIVLTHGHEDHVGALPFVLREIGTPPVIYGGALTIGLVRSKLEEHRMRDAPLEVLEPGERVRLGPFELELVHMAHSIPDSCAVVLRTELGPLLITGDYKFDQTPVDGNPADVSRLAELGAEGVLASAATRPMPTDPGSRRPSRASGRRSRPVLALPRAGSSSPRSPPTSIGSSRSSTLPPELDRRVALVALDAQELQHRLEPRIARIPDGMLIPAREIESFPDHEVVAISTGSQGEPLSALRRMAHARP